jgi:hypothetical protein
MYVCWCEKVVEKLEALGDDDTVDSPRGQGQKNAG